MSSSIVDIRVHPISVPLRAPVLDVLEPYTAAAEIVVEIETDDGQVGIGEIHGRPQADIVRILGHFRTILLGEDAIDHASLYERLFRVTFSRESALFAAAEGQPHFGVGAAPQMMAAIAGIDIAHDLKAKRAGLPLYRLLGGRRAAVRAYASGGYYGPDGEAAVEGSSRR